MQQKFEMERVGFLVTKVCNLKCRLCSAFSPYVLDKAHYSLDYLKKVVDSFFRITDFVKKASIAGGEPTLSPVLPDFLEYLANYIDKMGIVELVTNGTVVPSDASFEAMKLLGGKFNLLIDNYGTDLSRNVESISLKAKDFDVPYIIRDYYSENLHCSGWVDLSDITQKLNTDKEAELLFSKCAYPQKLKLCCGISDGKMFACTAVSRRYSLGFVKESTEYIDLLDETISKEEQRRKITEFYEAKSFSACAYCKGMCDDSPRYRPAEQLTAEEIRKIKENDRT